MRKKYAGESTTVLLFKLHTIPLRHYLENVQKVLF